MGAMSFAVSTMSEMYVAFGYILLACSVQQTVQLFRDAGGSGAIVKNPLCMEKLRGMTCDGNQTISGPASVSSRNWPGR